MKRILVVEDEQNIREFEVINLKKAGYETVEADCGEMALIYYDSEPETFDLALLDISMPGMNGFEVCKELRKRSNQLGIIILTARTMEQDKIEGLSIGADDYITKPFSPSELIARVDALYRRVSRIKTPTPQKTDEIKMGEFTLNIRRHTVTHKTKKIELTNIETGILEYLFTHKNQNVKRNEILSYVWENGKAGGAKPIDEKAVDVNIRRLRMKLEENPSKPAYLLTVWGVGYMWKSDN